MNSEFAILAFDDESTASEAMKDLQQLQKDGIVKVIDAAALVKDKRGKVTIKEAEDVDAKHGALFGAITGGLIGLLGGAPGALMGAAAGAGTGAMAAKLIDLGFPREFLRDLQDNLQPGSSALVALVEPTWIDHMIKELADLDGRLFRYSLATEMMDLPMKADVYCANGHAGHSTYVIANPDTQQVTHLVVKEDAIPFTERVVSIDQVAQTTREMTRLRCLKDELAQMPPFIQTDYILADIPNYRAQYGLYPNLPLDVPIEKRYIPLEHEYIPAGELAVHRGATVEATDGYVGRVDEFLVDPENEHITYLVMREGHLVSQKEVTIPVSAIARVEEDTVYLKLDKASIEALPAVPVGPRKML